MRLNFEQIKSITQGAEIIENYNNAVKFFRFNKAEQNLYSNTEFYQKTFSTAGVKLSFKTDGDTLFLKIKTSVATTRTYFSMDVFVDGKRIGSIKNFDEIYDNGYTQKEFLLGEFSQSFPLGFGEKCISVFFPWSVSTELEEIEIKNATYVIPEKKKKTILVYGDSITNGYDAQYSSNAYAVKLGDIFNAEVFNKAIGGEVFFPSLAKIKSDKIPDYITVAYGTNDWSLKEQDDFKVRCKQFYDTLATNYPDSQIFALTPIWRADQNGTRKFGEFCDVENCINEICSRYRNIKVISGEFLVPHFEEYFSDLILHPNDRGFHHYSNNLENEIIRVLR